MAMMNLLPTAVVPAACGASWWISDKPACFFVAGACASVFYLAGLAAFIVILPGSRGVTTVVTERIDRQLPVD
jgi:hypothetical protein